MPNPTAGDLHVNRLLSEFSVAYMNDADDFISTKVFPIVPVDKQSDNYATYEVSAFLKGRAGERAPGTESVGGGFKVNTNNSYFAKRYSYHHDLDDERRANADEPFEAEMDAVIHVTSAMMITMENIWKQKFFTTGVWSTDLTGGVNFTKWSGATSDPVNDIRTQSNLIKSKTGKRPNKLVIGADVLSALEEHPNIRDRFKYTSSESITPKMLANVFRLDEVIVAEAVMDSSDDGSASAPDFIFKDAALLVYAAPKPSKRLPSGGYTFVWQKDGLNVSIRTFRMEHLSSDRIEGDIYFDFKVIAPELGVFFSDVL